MDGIDLNLLATLDVLLDEASVARAARRLRLSPSAMSRALARLRQATGDPLLVRAGRTLVPTPRALELKAKVGQVVEDARAILRPAASLDLAHLVRTFTLRTSEGFVESFGPALIALVCQEAPTVQLRFVAKADKDSKPLRDGDVDLETGVVDEAMGPELRVQALFRDRFVGVVRTGHPLLSAKMTPSRYASGRHILFTRRGLGAGPVSIAVEKAGLTLAVAATVGSFSAALSLAKATDLIATVPERHTVNLRSDMESFPLPVPVPEFTVSMLWHPRSDADAAHRWLRRCVQRACAE